MPKELDLKVTDGQAGTCTGALGWPGSRVRHKAGVHALVRTRVDHQNLATATFFGWTKGSMSKCTATAMSRKGWTARDERLTRCAEEDDLSGDVVFFECLFDGERNAYSNYSDEWVSTGVP